MNKFIFRRTMTTYIISFFFFYFERQLVVVIMRLVFDLPTAVAIIWLVDPN